MKQLLNDNIPIYVPDWAKYLAIDEDGAVYVYKYKPKFNTMNMWDNPAEEFERLYYTEPPKDASKELYKLEWVYI